uniref:Regulatory protein zeste n=1 Tax=Globodera rostochiensis TaxID=31243 RepID=A0A914HBC6_GLORO
MYITKSTNKTPSLYIEPNSADQLGQIEPNSTDQNPPLTESDHSDNANSSVSKDERKRKIIDKFHAIKDELKQKGKYSSKERTQIEMKLWRKSWDLVIEQFTGGNVNLAKPDNRKISDEKIAKILKIGRATLDRWKREFKRQQFHPNSVDGHSVEENAAENVQGHSNNEWKRGGRDPKGLITPAGPPPGRKRPMVPPNLHEQNRESPQALKVSTIPCARVTLYSRIV